MFKFSILKEIDYNTLSKNIAIYQEANGEDPYLFISSETARAILNDKQAINLVDALERANDSDSFCGFRIYRNNDLAYGEVELR